MAAASAAATLREEGFDGEVLIVSDDDHPPYERPPLSKQLLADDSKPLPTLVRHHSWYAEHEVELRLGTRAVSIDPGSQVVRLSDGEQVQYSALLLATGVRARELPNSASSRMLTLRSVTDAVRLRERLASARQVLILGGGFIGCEAASTAIAMGKQVTIVERTATLMEAALGPAIGGVMTDLHRAAGVQVVTRSVVHFVEDTPSTTLVHTDRGTFEADLVIAGAGTRPNVELAVDAGLRVEGGVVTDEFSQTTAPAIFAAGDVAAAYHPFYRTHLRVEHHDTAMRHGASAARNMLGLNVPFNETHWFWSEQYGHSLQQVGRAGPADEVVVRGSLDALDFSAFWVREGRIMKVISLNRPKEVLATRRLLFAEHTVSDDQLRDESLALNRLVPRPVHTRREAS